jgi:hypothetical protein
VVPAGVAAALGFSLGADDASGTDGGALAEADVGLGTGGDPQADRHSARQIAEAAQDPLTVMRARRLTRARGA